MLTEQAIKAYSAVRNSDDLWRRCEGKDVFRELAKRELGFQSGQVAERHILHLWGEKKELEPQELEAKRDYITRL